MQKENSLVEFKSENGEEVKLSPTLIKKYLVRGGGNVSDQETMMFLSMCKYSKLNPFINEAYLVKFGNQPAQMITGKEALVKKANADRRYNGHRAGIIIMRNGEVEEIEGTFYLDDDILVGGWAEIHFHNKIPLKHTVKLSEFIGKKKDGTVNSMWAGKPATMIRKVALTQALREGLPETLNNLYGEEEMNVDTSNFNQVKAPTTVEVKEKVINPFEKKEEVPEAEIIPEPEKKEEPAQEVYEQQTLPWEEN